MKCMKPGIFIPIIALSLVLFSGIAFAEEPALAGELNCDDYTFSTCPAGCTAACISSSTGDGEGLADCEGVGSCAAAGTNNETSEPASASEPEPEPTGETENEPETGAEPEQTIETGAAPVQDLTMPITIVVVIVAAIVGYTMFIRK